MIKYVDNGSVYEISENDVEMILLTAAESAEIDLKTCSQRQWKWCLQQAGKYLNRTKSAFKVNNPGRGGPAYSVQTIIDIYNIYIELSNKYNKLISIESFSYYSAIPIDTIKSWQYADRAITDNITAGDALQADTVACNTDSYNRDIYNINSINNIENDNSIDSNNSINNNIINNSINNNNNVNSSIRYYNKYNNCLPTNNNRVDNRLTRRLLADIYKGLLESRRECILDKAFDSNTSLSSPFLYNTEFGSYSGSNERSALPVSGGDRRAIAARYGFQQIEQHDD